MLRLPGSTVLRPREPSPPASVSAITKSRIETLWSVSPSGMSPTTKRIRACLFSGGSFSISSTSSKPLISSGWPLLTEVSSLAVTASWPGGMETVGEVGATAVVEGASTEAGGAGVVVGAAAGSCERPPVARKPITRPTRIVSTTARTMMIVCRLSFGVASPPFMFSPFICPPHTRDEVQEPARRLLRRRRPLAGLPPPRARPTSGSLRAPILATRRSP